MINGSSRLGLAQAGEFGFVLIAFSLQQGVIPRICPESCLLVIALSMLITPLLFILYELLSSRMGDEDHEPDEIDELGPVIIAGIGRFGQIVNRLVRASGFKTVVLDRDIETIQLMRRFGVRAYVGDPTRRTSCARQAFERQGAGVAMDDPATARDLIGIRAPTPGPAYHCARHGPDPRVQTVPSRSK